jgi:hypothetical protein
MPDPDIITSQEFQGDLTGHVFGIVDEPQTDVPAITGELLAAGVPIDGIHMYCCRSGVEAFDAEGTRHGLRARINRVIQNLVYEDQLVTIERNLTAGNAVIGVDVEDGSADRIADIFRRHGGHDIVHYGRFSWERLSARTRHAPTRPLPT